MCDFKKYKLIFAIIIGTMSIVIGGVTGHVFELHKEEIEINSARINDLERRLTDLEDAKLFYPTWDEILFEYEQQ